jgi:Fe-S cluster assembly iron-binding protein IscA
MMVNLTGTAIHKFKEALKQENLKDHGIRIFVSPGG